VDPSPDLRVRRVYAAAEPADGMRVLVDRLWPRGLSREAAAIDHWCRAVAPSAELRGWFGHDPDRFEEFARRYRDELRGPEPAAAIAAIAGLWRRGPTTLLTAVRALEVGHATVLERVLRERRAPASP
jgi:uncharacterized protein YeaO (DUF488 family)